MKALQDIYPEIRETGSRLIAISPMLPDSTLSMVEKHELTFAVLSDQGHDDGDSDDEDERAGAGLPGPRGEEAKRDGDHKGGDSEVADEDSPTLDFATSGGSR